MRTESDPSPDRGVGIESPAPEVVHGQKESDPTQEGDPRKGLGAGRRGRTMFSYRINQGPDGVEF